MIDAFGRTVTVQTVDGLDVYTAGNVTLSYPAGTDQAQALNALAGMAPDSWSPPKPAPVVPAQVANASARRVMLTRFVPSGASFYTVVQTYLQGQVSATASLADNDASKIAALSAWTQWDMGNFFIRADPLVGAMAQIIQANGGTVDLDELFIAAGAL